MAIEYILKSKDNPILLFCYIPGEDIDIVEVYQPELVPVRLRGRLDSNRFGIWLSCRISPHGAKVMRRIQKACGIHSKDTIEFLLHTHGLSLNDSFWVDGVYSDLSWESVNLYQNPFPEDIAEIAFTGSGGSSPNSLNSPEYTSGGNMNSGEKQFTPQISNEVSMIKYLHMHPDWPNFFYDQAKLFRKISPIRFQQGILLGQISGLGFDISDSMSLDAVAREIVSSSAIEGVVISPDVVRSSLCHRLGFHRGGLTPPDRAVEGLVDLMLDATQNFGPMTRERLCSWQAALFPTGRSGMYKIRVGDFRQSEDGEMQIVSGPTGRQRVHYVAPEADRLDYEMEKFLAWLNTESDLDDIVKAGIAHLWFVSLHPFEDGNGRIARAISDYVIAKAEGSPYLFYSVSSEINLNRDSYYKVLECTQRGELDITLWLEWVADIFERSIIRASGEIEKTIRKVADIDRSRKEQCNVRQTGILYRLYEGFEGNLTVSKYSKIFRCSQEDASADLHRLVKIGLLGVEESGQRGEEVFSLANPVSLDSEIDEKEHQGLTPARPYWR